MGETKLISVLVLKKKRKKKTFYIWPITANCRAWGTPPQFTWEANTAWLFLNPFVVVFLQHSWHIYLLFEVTSINFIIVRYVAFFVFFPNKNSQLSKWHWVSSQLFLHDRHEIWNGSIYDLLLLLCLQFYIWNAISSL